MSKRAPDAPTLGRNLELHHFFWTWRVSTATRNQVIRAVGERYRASSAAERIASWTSSWLLSVITAIAQPDCCPSQPSSLVLGG